MDEVHGTGDVACKLNIPLARTNGPQKWGKHWHWPSILMEYRVDYASPVSSSQFSRVIACLQEQRRALLAFRNGDEVCAIPPGALYTDIAGLI